MTTVGFAPTCQPVAAPVAAVRSFARHPPHSESAARYPVTKVWRAQKGAMATTGLENRPPLSTAPPSSKGLRCCRDTERRAARPHHPRAGAQTAPGPDLRECVVAFELRSLVRWIQGVPPDATVIGRTAVIARLSHIGGGVSARAGQAS